MLFMSCVCHAFASAHCCLVVTRSERADLMSLVCEVYCDFVSFPFGILGQVCYLIVSISDPCCLSYFYKKKTIGIGVMFLNQINVSKRAKIGN